MLKLSATCRNARGGFRPFRPIPPGGASTTLGWVAGATHVANAQVEAVFRLRRWRGRCRARPSLRLVIDLAPARCHLTTWKAVAHRRGTWEAAGDRNEAPISLQGEVVVVDDPELHQRQVRAIRSFLLSLATRVGDAFAPSVRAAWAWGLRSIADIDAPTATAANAPCACARSPLSISPDSTPASMMSAKTCV